MRYARNGVDAPHSNFSLCSVRWRRVVLLEFHRDRCPIFGRPLELDPGGLAPADPLSPSLAGSREPRSAPAGAPVARLARYAASSNEYRALVSSRMTGYEANPTRYLSPVGAGTPPSGSSVTAMATGAGMSGGVSNDAVTLPLSSGRMSPALIGRLAVTTQS